MPALVSFDDFELAELMPVPVTVVDHDPRQLGREAARLLLSRLGSGARRGVPPRMVEMPVRVAPAAPLGLIGRPELREFACDRYGNVTNAASTTTRRTSVRTVAIDLGGTAVKLGVFESGRLVASDEFAAVDGQIGLDEVADRVEVLLDGERPLAIGIAVPGVVDPGALEPAGRSRQVRRAARPRPLRLVAVRGSGAPRSSRTTHARPSSARSRTAARADAETPCSSCSAPGSARPRSSTAASSAGATAMARSSAATSRWTSTARGARAATSAAPRPSRARGRWTADAAAGDLVLGPALAARLADRGAIGIRDLVETRDEPESAAILDRYIRTWAAVIVTQCHAFDPDVVVVTGGVMRAADIILPALRDRVHADLWSSSFRPPFVTPDDPATSVLRGLAALARRTPQQRTAMTTVDSRGIPLEDYMLDDRSSYVKLPTVALPAGSEVLVGDEAWKAAMDIASAATGHPLIAVDVYPGGDVAAIAARIRGVLAGVEVIDVEDAAAADPEVIDALITRNLTDDRVFGVMSHFTIDEFYDADRLVSLQRRVEERTRPTVLVGWGADLAARRRADALVLVDLARWEIQQRMRAGAAQLAREQR